MKGVKQRLTLTAAQIATILGIEDFVIKHGLILCCPRCTVEGSPFVDTDNTPGAREWKIDCDCTERRILATKVTQPMDADPELLAQVEDILRPAALTMRCPIPKCVTAPLIIERVGPDTVVRCSCTKRTIHPPRLRHQRVH